jgi:tyrosinase
MGVLPDDKRALLEQAQKDGLVIGLGKITEVEIDRLDIDDLLFKEPDTFNVFLLALRNLKNQNPTEKTSFFQLAGIHGLPLKLWDNDTGGAKEMMKDPLSDSGYCTHANLAFSTWHRPYLALLEVC